MPTIEGPLHAPDGSAHLVLNRGHPSRTASTPTITHPTFSRGSSQRALALRRLCPTRVDDT
jgi:hypothetical protein